MVDVHERSREEPGRAEEDVGSGERGVNGDRAVATERGAWAGVLVLAGCSAVALISAGVLCMNLPVRVGAAAGTLLGVLLPACVAAALRGELPAAGRVAKVEAGRAALVGLCLAVFGSGAVGLIAASSERAREALESRAEWFESLLAPGDPSAIPAVLVSVALLPGLCEEFLFRGVMRERLAAIAPLRRAVGLGIVFGALHLDWVALLPLCAIGFALTRLGDRTGGWAAPAVAHMTLNAFNGVVWPRAVGEGDLPALLLVALCAGGAGGAWLAGEAGLRPKGTPGESGSTR